MPHRQLLVAHDDAERSVEEAGSAFVICENGTSVFVDVTLLMVLIWSFHIQYMQPPGFYLKAPTLLAVFIVNYVITTLYALLVPQRLI